MKKIILTITALIFIISFSACHINDPYNDHYVDTTPPSAPGGVYVLNGDNVVDISWDSNYENDVAGYNVYYAYSYNGKYTLIGSTEGTHYTDDGANNGTTYYYAVTAYDYDGNESDLSPDVAYATPRPEGYNQTIFDYLNFPDNAGYSFTTYSAVPYDDQSTDFFFENYNGSYYLDVYKDSDIQDMGATNDIYDIPYAPTNGWSSSKDAVAKVGHTYVIWTWDNHYAKIRVSNITPERIEFDWTFQLVQGNKELKPLKKSGTRVLEKVNRVRE